MSGGPEFFQTMMGRKFFDADVPRFLRALERIADALEANGKQHADDVLEEVGMTAAFAMRESCAEEASAMWGREYGDIMRNVKLPHEQEIA